MRERLSDYQEEYEGELFNLEATPAESTAYRLAKHDRKRWPDIRTAGKEGDTPYYTNSSHLPVEYTTMFRAPWISRMSCRLFILGTVFHAFIEKLPDWKAGPLQHWYVRSQREYKLRYHFSYLFRMQGTWLYQRRTFYLSEMWKKVRSTMYYRILPSCTELERWQGTGI